MINIYRVALITNMETVAHSDFKTREEVDEYLLKYEESEGLKKYRILNLEENIILETEKGIRK